MPVSRRSFLASILAASVAPLYIPNMKVWVPKQLSPEDLIQQVNFEADEIVKNLAAGLVRVPATGTYHFDKNGIVFNQPKVDHAWIKPQPLIVQPMDIPRDLVYFKRPSWS